MRMNMNVNMNMCQAREHVGVDVHPHEHEHENESKHQKDISTRINRKIIGGGGVCNELTCSMLRFLRDK
jgi:hypothetical protein